VECPREDPAYGREGRLDGRLLVVTLAISCPPHYHYTCYALIAVKRFCVNCNALIGFDSSTCSACGKSALVIQHSAKDSDRSSGPTINLSCGYCGAIRPFTENPPTCTVCGWVLGTSPRNHSTTQPRTGWRPEIDLSKHRRKIRALIGRNSRKISPLASVI